MPISVTVLYPKDEGSTFDLEYYKKSHMPMVAESWKPYNFKGYRVLEFKSMVDEQQSPPPYSVQCSLEFDNAEDLKKALEETGPKVIGDIPNFSNRQPVLILGDQVLTS